MNHSGSPPTARHLAREQSGVPSWAALAVELDRWTEIGKSATFWWRDDDAVAATPALERLLALSERHRAPLALAVIPKPAEVALAERLTDSVAPVIVVQHGIAHRNHAPASVKKTELGDHRDSEITLAELTDGRKTLEKLFGDRFLAAMVPPWNRIGPKVEAALPSSGFRGLSTFGPRRSAGIGQVNSHIDIIDWHGGRGFVGETVCLDAAIGHLADRRTGRCDPDEPTGLLTHHLVHDAACWRFMDRLLAAVNDHPAAGWRTLEEALVESRDGAGV